MSFALSKIVKINAHNLHGRTGDSKIERVLVRLPIAYAGKHWEHLGLNDIKYRRINKTEIGEVQK